MATSPVELWYSVHQQGNDLCLSPGWPTKDEAIATGHMKAGKFLGVICSGWLHPSASAASAGRPRIDKLLDDLRAIPDQIALIEDELRYSIGAQLKGGDPHTSDHDNTNRSGLAADIARAHSANMSGEPLPAARVDPQDAELVTRVAEALYASNPLCVGVDGQNLLEFTEVAKMKPHVHARLMADARAAIQAVADHIVNLSK